MPGAVQNDDVWRLAEEKVEKLYEILNSHLPQPKSMSLQQSDFQPSNGDLSGDTLPDNSSKMIDRSSMIDWESVANQFNAYLQDRHRKRGEEAPKRTANTIKAWTFKSSHLGLQNIVAFLEGKDENLRDTPLKEQGNHKIEEAVEEVVEESDDGVHDGKDEGTYEKADEVGLHECPTIDRLGKLFLQFFYRTFFQPQEKQ